ncbi:hypothetical protein Z517_03283 [Fonsecaea pedrosoi CBS 271.37]|uniref:Beta-lactamase-related domain-containing protein n=1 Tax=Fonsecaea pedrosoi CBS 271.37 TaxID=1442368 RepID=A0A0D2FBQ1_9EURO|nr:uncharacterized protein Z517_03283 [Fonsecaea pedrosoi CBS 271.37]KIW84037.1 hypothetical protein Z517_03283 [Fonsecaea pedrosoi CBS 271.37]
MSTFQSSLEARIAEGPKGILSAVVVGFGRDGKDVVMRYEKSAGRQSWSADTPASLDSTFWAFSCTKLLTTIAALQCVERGLVTLDTEVATILPELKDPQVIVPDGDSFTLNPAAAKITLGHLLSHTSGLNYDAMNPLTTAWRKSRGEAPLVFSGRVKDSYSTPLLFEPGEGWVYGGSIDWAGILVERLNGNVKLGEYVETNIFKPLGMNSSTFDIKSRPDIQDKLLEMSYRGSDGLLVPSTSPYTGSSAEHSGGMGLVTSVADFAAVLMDLIRETPILLKSETVEQMFKPQFLVGSAQHKGLLAQDSLHKQLTGIDSGDASAPISFGLGGLITLEKVPNLPKGTLTWNGMPNIGWYVNRGLGQGGLFVTQILPAGDEISVQLLGQLERDAWKAYYAHHGGE